MSNNCFENLSRNHKAWIHILTATIFHTDEEKYQLPMIWSVWTRCQQKVRRHWQNHFLEHATDVQTRVQHGIAYPIPRPTKRQSSTLARFYDFSAFFPQTFSKSEIGREDIFLIKNLGISVRWRCNPYNILIFLFSECRCTHNMFKQTLILTSNHLIKKYNFMTVLQYHKF